MMQVNKLRSSIQTLTKSAHPLGKLMDFLQEDVDSMQVLRNIKHKELDDKKNNYQNMEAAEEKTSQIKSAPCH